MKIRPWFAGVIAANISVFSIQVSAVNIDSIVRTISNLNNSDELSKIYSITLLKASDGRIKNAAISAVVSQNYKGRQYYMADATYDGIASKQNAMVIFQVCYWGPLMILLDTHGDSAMYTRAFNSPNPDFIVYEKDYCLEEK